jgi:hypothetical protein
VYARVAELEAERTQARADLAALTGHQPPTVDPGLLDALPQLPARFTDLPVSTRHKLYQAFGIEILFNHGVHQITCRATIAPHTVTAIINDSNSPTPTSSDSLCAPMRAKILPDHGRAGRSATGSRLRRHPASAGPGPGSGSSCATAA